MKLVFWLLNVTGFVIICHLIHWEMSWKLLGWTLLWAGIVGSLEGIIRRDVLEESK